MATQQWLQQLRDEPKVAPVAAAGPQQLATVFCVPELVRSVSPEYHRRKELQLGLHNRSIQTRGTQLLKIDIARFLHSKLLSTGGSWEAFVVTVVGDLQTARGHFQNDCSGGLADEVVQFLLALDALFLVALFQFFNGENVFLDEFQPLKSRLRDTARTLVRSDLLLLENQIPMYLLENVVAELVANKAAPTDTAKEKLIQVENELDNVLKVAVDYLYPFGHADESGSTACWMFRRHENRSKVPRFYAHLDKTYPLDNQTKLSLRSCRHILDCVYVAVCGLSLPFPQRTPPRTLDSIPSVSSLRACGISVADRALTLNQIKLKGCGYITNATLSLPKVNVYDFTETVFHNLALHEQLTSSGGDMWCFLQCMASLSNNKADIALLVDRGVVNDTVGVDALGMWNRTMRGVYTPLPSRAWQQCYRNIHWHRRNRVKRWRREAFELFFSRPWTFVSLVGAAIILFLTAVQTWFTVVNSGRRGWRWPALEAAGGS